MALRLAKDAYTPEALMDAGVDPMVVRTLLADGPNAVPERPRLAVNGRKRAKEATSKYVWGPDAMTLLAEQQKGAR